jgi:hypothetical protein
MGAAKVFVRCAIAALLLAAVAEVSFRFLPNAIEKIIMSQVRGQVVWSQNSPPLVYSEPSDAAASFLFPSLVFSPSLLALHPQRGSTGTLTPPTPSSSPSFTSSTSPTSPPSARAQSLCWWATLGALYSRIFAYAL